MLDENAKTHPMLRPYKTFSEKVREGIFWGEKVFGSDHCVFSTHASTSFIVQDKEIYRWPIKESIKAMIAWEWTLDKARDGDEDKGEKKAARKISQTAQVFVRDKKFKRDDIIFMYYKSNTWLIPETGPAIQHVTDV